MTSLQNNNRPTPRPFVAPPLERTTRQQLTIKSSILQALGLQQKRVINRQPKLLNPALLIDSNEEIMEHDLNDVLEPVRLDLVFKGHQRSIQMAVWSRMAQLEVFGLVWRYFVFFVLVNLLFAGLYCLEPGGCCQFEEDVFVNSFWFSFQTYTTVGYGGFSPLGNWANFIAYMETCVAIVAQTVVTGMLFLSFMRSRPDSIVRVAGCLCLCSDAQTGTPTLRIRIGNLCGDAYRLVNVSFKVWIGRQEGNIYINRPLELDSDVERPLWFLPLTLFHMVKKENKSPFYGETPETFAKMRATVTIMLVGTEEATGNNITYVVRLTHKAIMWGRDYLDMFKLDPERGPYIEWANLDKSKPSPLRMAASADDRVYLIERKIAEEKSQMRERSRLSRESRRNSAAEAETKERDGEDHDHHLIGSIQSHSHLDPTSLPNSTSNLNVLKPPKGKTDPTAKVCKMISLHFPENEDGQCVLEDNALCDERCPTFTPYRDTEEETAARARAKSAITHD